MLGNGQNSFLFGNWDAQAWHTCSVKEEAAVFYNLRRWRQFLGMAQHADLDRQVQEKLEGSHSLLKGWAVDDAVIDPDPDPDGGAILPFQDKIVPECHIKPKL
jgi:hypothetical protein